MSDLEVLFPEPHVVVVMGSRVRIKPVTLENFEKFSKMGAATFALLADPAPIKYFEFSKNTALLQGILACCTTLSWRQRRKLPAAAALELTLHVLRVNADFFDQALLAQANQLVGQVQSRP
jgi:hypothetical protein